MLAEKAIERLSDSGRFVPVLVRVETEAPVDDILVKSASGNFIFIQAKTHADLSTNLNSPLGKTAQQFVQQWKLCKAGTGAKEWDRPLLEGDRLLLAVGSGASNSLRHDLAIGLRSDRMAAHAPLPEGQENALNRFNELLRLAWLHLVKEEPAPQELRQLMSHVDILVFDFEAADRELVNEMMRGLVLGDAIGSFSVLSECFLRLMSRRRGVDSLRLRTLVSATLSLKEPPSYSADVKKLRDYSDRTREHLEHFEETTVGGQIIQIERSCTAAVLRALDGSLLLVGEPGAGKSAVISTIAARFRKEGREVLELAVDRLPVESPEGLQNQLGLDHSILGVLENWPGNGPAYMFIDALDATRGGQSTSIFRWLIAEILKFPGGRWRIVASIRSFDLRMGQQLADLFPGEPPNSLYSDPVFRSVRHIHIPPWEDRELTELMEQAPSLAKAVQVGGPRLFDLARMPFNTRLLADLLSGGMFPDEFRDVDSQARLLDRYWAYRVRKHGTSAEVCLGRVVDLMVANGSLQANRLSAAKTSPDALDKLLKENVLMAVSGDRFVAFRHHILFDFAASRLFIDLADDERTSAAFQSERSFGLLLGPALIFALKENWSFAGADRKAFWRVIMTCVGRPDVDPVIRSIAARVACELPKLPEDVQALLEAFGGTDEEREQARIVLMHIVASLSVRLEDKEPVAVEAWSYFASQLAPYIGTVSWPLRMLLFLLLEKCAPPASASQLGAISRSLFSFALTHSEQLVTSSIGFVAATYASDPGASRVLLASLFEPDRFAEHGDDDISWLTRAMAPIAAVDPDFVVEIYGATFSRDITDDTTTSIGQSAILSLTSNRRQDYQMSFWNLKEFFPRFLESHPLPGIKAYLKAIHGYIEREHPANDSQTQHGIEIVDRRIRLWEDWSYIWASDPDEQNADNASEMTRTFVAWLTAAPSELALAAADIILTENAYGLVWARLLMVAAQRADIFREMLWPIATSYPFLWATDTRKDAIDFISANYPALTLQERKAFEQRVIKQDFGIFEGSVRLRDYVLSALFRSIPAILLATDAAKALAAPKEGEHPTDYENERSISTVRSFGMDDYWFLSHQGVDPTLPTNAPILAAAKALNTALEPNNRVAAFPTLSAAMGKLTGFLADVDGWEDADYLVRSHAEGIAADALKTIAAMFENEISKDWDTAAVLIGIVKRFVDHPFPEMSETTEQDFENGPSWGSPAPRVSASEAAITLARTGERAARELRATIEHFVGDVHPAVRLSAARHLTALWFSDRDFMWEQIGRVLENERNGSVLSFFANADLLRLLHADPERIEEITKRLDAQLDDTGGRKKLRKQVGNFVAVLWVSQGRPWPKTVIQKWLGQIPLRVVELDQVIAALRGAVVHGYESNTEQDDQIRRRALELADLISKVAAGKLEASFKSPPESEVDKAEVTACSSLIGHILNQLYFSSGAFQTGQPQNQAPGLKDLDVKRRYLAEITPILVRIIAVGSPHTIHYLVSLLEFLVEAEPKKVFSLVVDAVLGASEKFGYQYESLGVDQVVKVVGRYLADYREIFDDPQRRRDLVRCLDVFIEAGWPSARRLLYRLPELLQ